MKVFATGLQRTGTMSLTRAFTLLGLKARQFPYELMDDVEHAVVHKFDAFTDFPVPLLYQQLDQAYPGSRFVHTLRDEDAWIESVRWLFSAGRVKFAWDRNPHVDRVHRAFYGTTCFSEGLFRERYRSHNQGVLDHFSTRPGDLLLLQIGSGSEFDQLCPFLGLPVPEVPFPRTNEREPETRVRLRKLWQALRRHLSRRR